MITRYVGQLLVRIGLVGITEASILQLHDLSNYYDDRQRRLGSVSAAVFFMLIERSRDPY